MTEKLWHFLAESTQGLPGELGWGCWLTAGPQNNHGDKTKAAWRADSIPKQLVSLWFFRVGISWCYHIPVPAQKLLGNRYSRGCCHLSKAAWTQPMAVHARDWVHISSFMWTHTHWDSGIDPPDWRHLHCECKLAPWARCPTKHAQHSLHKYLFTLEAEMLFLIQLPF